ncbi:MAG: DUF1761 domain-containing protein [Pseudomonadota bacterium]
MGSLVVLAAAVAGFIFGAVWYTALGKAWLAVSGVPVKEDGKPINDSNPLIYLTSLVGAVLVAGMMRHVFVLSGIDTTLEGLVSGLGIGLFFVLPFVAQNHIFSARPMRLTLIDGGYCVLSCTVIGTVLTLF